MKNRSVLNIISESYPYGKGEQFFDLEVKELAEKFDQIVLFPLSNEGGQRSVPANVHVNNALVQLNRKRIRKINYVKNLILIVKIFFLEFKKSNNKKVIFSQLKPLVVSIVKCADLSMKMAKSIDNSDKNYFYSFWMNEGALLLSILKAKKKIDKFFFRVNGYDIFNERHEGNYLRFRRFNYKQVQSILVLSQGALKYLKALDIYPNKLKLAHYGVLEKGLNHLNGASEIVRIVSCSSLIPLKRIDKIIDSLALIQNIKIEWIHFGNGPLMDELKVKAATVLPTTISYDFRGSVSNDEILKLYASDSVNIFIHTSETEGLGMSIIEAQSFGIPAVVLGVGGVTDIVSNETGRILDEHASIKEIAAAIQEVLESDLNSNEKRKEIQNKCLEIFDAHKNYQQVVNILTQ